MGTSARRLDFPYAISIRPQTAFEPRARGTLDRKHLRTFEEALSHGVNSAAGNDVVVDMREVPSIGPDAIAALFEWSFRGRQRGLCVRVDGCRKPVLKSLAMVGIGDDGP